MATLAYPSSLSTSTIDDARAHDMSRFAFAQIHGDVHLVQRAYPARPRRTRTR